MSDYYEGVPAEWEDLVGADGASPPPNLDHLFPVVDWHGLWATTPAEAEFVCEPLLEKGRSTALYSPPKHGKSLLALEIAAAICSGRAVLGNPRKKPLTVLYVDLENTGADIKERLEDLGYGPGDLSQLRYLSFPNLAALDTHVGGSQIVELVDHHHADVVVIDTVSRVISGEENDADTFARLYRHALVPLKARGVTVLRLDHSGKDPEKGQRGSSAKSADVDHVWRLVDHGNNRIALHRDASRTGHGVNHVALERRLNPLRHVPPGGPLLDGRVAQVITALDDAELPDLIGRARARDALSKVGIKASTGLIAEAVRTRKERSNLSRTGAAADPPETQTEDCPESRGR